MASCDDALVTMIPFAIVCTSACVGTAYSGHMATGGERMLADLEFVLPPPCFVNAQFVRCQEGGPAADFGRFPVDGGGFCVLSRLPRASLLAVQSGEQLGGVVDRVGVAMHDLPLAVLAPEDRRAAEHVRRRFGACYRGCRPFDRE